MFQRLVKLNTRRLKSLNKLPRVKEQFPGREGRLKVNSLK